MKFFFIAGLFQGLNLIVALLKRSILDNLVNKLLLILLVSIIVILTFFLSWLTNWVDIPNQLNPLAMMSWFCVSPLFYLYIQASCDAGFKMVKRHVLYFIFPLYHFHEILVQWMELPFRLQPLFPDFTTYSIFLSVLYTIHTLVFCFLSIKYLSRYTSRHAVFMRRFFYAFAVATILFFIDGLFYVFSKNNPLLQQSLIVFFSGFVQYSAIASIRDSSHLMRQKKKYQNVKFTENEQGHLKQNLEHAMVQEELYLDPELTLLQLARHLDVSENSLSRLLTEGMNTGFYEYLRMYRLAEFERRARMSAYANKKITAIAEESGFKSKTAFYKAFKEKHGISPSAYIKALNPSLGPS